MHAIEYILHEVRVASLGHAGTLEEARITAADGVRRHKAEYARIVCNASNAVEILGSIVSQQEPI